MDVDPVQQREQLRTSLRACGADLTLFEDIDLDKLWGNRYRSVRGLRDASREGLSVAGLPPGLLDHILSLKEQDPIAAKAAAKAKAEAAKAEAEAAKAEAEAAKAKVELAIAEEQLRAVRAGQPQINAGASTAGSAARIIEISISGVNSRTWGDISAAMGICVSMISEAPITATPVEGTAPFAWLPLPESAAANREAAMKHLKSILPPPAGEEWYDCFPKRTMLTCNLPGTNITMKGTADFALCTSASLKAYSPQNGLRIVMELKKDTSDFNKEQLAAELLTANVWSSFKPIAVMTDLVDAWWLMWAAAEREVHLYVCNSCAEAIGILRTFLDKERLKPDSSGIITMDQQEAEAAGARADRLFKRPKLLRVGAASGAGADVANLDDLQDFGGGLGLSDVDLHQLRCASMLRGLLEIAAPKLIEAAEDTWNVDNGVEAAFPNMYS